MPLTSFQKRVLALLTGHRSESSHLAGASGLALSTESKRFSHDLDYFHDSEASVAEAFASDKSVLEAAGFSIKPLLSQPGFIRALVSDPEESVRVDWAHDTSWRFMPPIEVEAVGFVLHPVDLAINKVLALAGRDEPRDMIDILFVHDQILPLGALIWAASGKDPGMSPSMLHELLRRKGKLREEDLRHLDMKEPMDVVALRSEWQAALAQAGAFIDSRPPEEAGCLYVDIETMRFTVPDTIRNSKPHHASQGGILPAVDGFKRPDALAKEFFSL